MWAKFVLVRPEQKGRKDAHLQKSDADRPAPIYFIAGLTAVAP